MAGPADWLRPAAAPSTPAESTARFPWTAVGVFLGIGIYLWYVWLWLIQGETVGAAILLGPILLVLSTPLLLAASRRTLSFDLTGLLLTSMVIRFLFCYYRATHAIDGYLYHVAGLRMADAYRALNFTAPTGKDVPGTGGMYMVAGWVHVLVGSDYLASYLFMTWLGFIGCYLLYRAFEMAMPTGDHYRYARLVLLWPSMCFWPSSLGKDSWMVFTIGIAAYGAARVFTRQVSGYTLFGLGLFGASFVRPHLALLTLLAFVIALLVSRRQGVGNALTPSFIAKLVGLAIVIVIGSVLVSRTQQLLDIEDFSSTSLDSVATHVGSQTSVGNSVFSAPNPRSPAGFAEATVTVLFRPFPNEAHGSEALMSAAEGMFLALLTILSFRRLLTIPGRLRAQPEVMFALAFVLLWILAFGIINNFGILARQRTQMLPFYFVLLSVTAAAKKPWREFSAAEPHAIQ